MAETENAVPCMNVSPSVVFAKDIVGEEDTDSGEMTPGHDHDKCIKEQLAALNMEDSDKLDFVGEEDTDSGETRPVHDHDKCIKEQQAPLHMEDSDKEMTSEDEMDFRGLMCCGRTDFDHMYYIDLLQAREKYFPSQPKPLTWEEWDVLLTKKEMEGYEDLCLKYPPPKEDSEYTLVWSDTDEE